MRAAARSGRRGSGTVAAGWHGMADEQQALPGARQETGQKEGAQRSDAMGRVAIDPQARRRTPTYDQLLRVQPLLYGVLSRLLHCLQRDAARLEVARLQLVQRIVV